MTVAQQEYENVFTVTEVAHIFKVSVQTIRRLIRSGRLPAMRIGHHYRVPKSSIDEYFARPTTTLFTPEEAGFGIWRDRQDIGDGVDYVNRIRSENRKSLRETIKELEGWENQQTF